MRHGLVSNLWNTPSSDGARPRFDARWKERLPVGAQRYLDHALPLDKPLASAVRLTMHGEIKFQSWLPFRAEQVIESQRGFVWKARVRKGLTHIRGADSLVDGVGRMQWKLFGLLPVMTAEGDDVTRSNIGRFLGESLWLPSMLARDDVMWDVDEGGNPAARITAYDASTRIALETEAGGRLLAASFPRWGDVDGSGTFRLATFGVVADAEGVFDGYTIPTRIRAGWHDGSDGLGEGEFFRATVDAAKFR